MSKVWTLSVVFRDANTPVSIDFPHLLTASRGELYLSPSTPPPVLSLCTTMPRLHILGDPSAAADYPPVDHNQIVRLEIFPPIGIARVGDSEIECFLAPEVPGLTYPPNGLRVSDGQVCSSVFHRTQHTQSYIPLRPPGVQVSGPSPEAQTPGFSIHGRERLLVVDNSFIRLSASASMRTMSMATSSAKSTAGTGTF
jgi:hypothetical protein